MHLLRRSKDIGGRKRTSTISSSRGMPAHIGTLLRRSTNSLATSPTVVLGVPSARALSGALAQYMRMFDELLPPFAHQLHVRRIWCAFGSDLLDGANRIRVYYSVGGWMKQIRLVPCWAGLIVTS